MTGERIPDWVWRDNVSFSFIISSSTSSLTSFSSGGICIAVGIGTVFLIPLRESSVSLGGYVCFSLAFLCCPIKCLSLRRDTDSSGSSENIKSTAVGTSGVCKSCILFTGFGGFKEFHSARVLEVGLIWAGFNSPCILLSSRTCGFLGIVL